MTDTETRTCPLCGCPEAGERCRDHRERAAVYTGKRKKTTLVPDE